MNREYTADSSSCYDSHDDNDGFDDEVEDDYVDSNPGAEYNSDVLTKTSSVGEVSHTDKKLLHKGPKAKGGSRKKKGSRKKRPSVVANLAATKFSIGTCNHCLFLSYFLLFSFTFEGEL